VWLKDSLLLLRYRYGGRGRDVLKLLATFMATLGSVHWESVKINARVYRNNNNNNYYYYYSILYYLCAQSTAVRPITDTAQCTYR
jgi:hypothetical protein